jgi:hypothetical protein
LLDSILAQAEYNFFNKFILPHSPFILVFPMPHLFLSYSRVDLTFVERLAADLKSAGCDT